ncbi:hypothetical protein RDV78_05140 [Bacillota bacterium LX-D]|nr:hypothetical protein [Bacillota bacterium LX-D]
MSLHYLDPFKLTLKEVEEVIFYYKLEDKLKELLIEVSRMDYNGYIKLSKPRDLYSQKDWERVFEVLQTAIIESKEQKSNEPLPDFIEKKLRKILQRADFQGFKCFVEVNSAYLPPEVVQESNNMKFLNWLYARLRDNTLVLERNNIRLGINAKPEDLVY